MYYNLLYQCVFCLAFINFLIYWIDLFFFSFSTKGKKNFSNLFSFFSTIRLYSIWPFTFLKTKFNWNKIDNLTIRSFFSKFVPNQLKTNKDHEYFFITTNLNEKKEKKLNQEYAYFEITKFISGLILWFSITLLILFRFIRSNHFPLSNFYEALIFLTWGLVTLNFIILFEPFKLFPLIYSNTISMFFFNNKKFSQQQLQKIIYTNQKKQNFYQNLVFPFWGDLDSKQKITNRFSNFQNNNVSRTFLPEKIFLPLQSTVSLKILPSMFIPWNQIKSESLPNRFSFFSLLKQVITIPFQFFLFFQPKSKVNDAENQKTFSVFFPEPIVFNEKQPKEKQTLKKIYSVQEKKIYGGILAPCIVRVVSYY